MSNPWFRMYSEFSHDPKVQTMSEAMQRRYTMVMCMRCSNDLVTLHETDIAFYLRISEQDLAETKALFITKGFIDSGWNLLNWEKRQMLSDTSNARVAKHRALQKEKQEAQDNGAVTLQKRKSNALEQNRTDTDKKNTRAPPEGVAETVWKDYVQLRKTKKATVSESIVDGVREEAAKVGLTLEQALKLQVQRGWQGFDASWVKSNPGGIGGMLPGAI